METIKAGLRPARAACAARGARPKLGALLRRHEKRLLGILFILPALCLLWQFSYGAFLQTVWNSVHLTNIQGQAVSFCGLELYRTLLTSGEFWNSCFVSVKFVLMTVFPSLAIALLLAALCRKRLPGGKLGSVMFQNTFQPSAPSSEALS